MDYLQCEIFRLSDTNEAVPYGSLSYMDAGDYVAMGATLHLEAGIYFLSIRIDQSYPYSPEPVYYVILTEW